MFSPDAASLPQVRPLRPKRSRQPAPDDSIKLPRAKKQRSALRKDTFEPLSETNLNEVAGRSNGITSLNGQVKEAPAATDGSPPPSKQLTLRGGKKPEKRLERRSAALTLSSNDFYNVSQLPALPEQLRKNITAPYTSTISPEYGYALGLTHSDVVIWLYNSFSSSPAPKDLFVFSLPFPEASKSDPLPLAAFAARSGGGEPGLVVVTPKKGKVVYWESITNASSFVPGQTSGGFQGSIPGMLSGETVIDITIAEPAGFILTFSHGRVAHLTVRDQMGRPGIGIQFMRKYAGGGGNTLFGSLRNVFVGDRRKHIAAVKAGKSAKGRRDVIIATEDGTLEFWNIDLSIGNTMIQEISVKEDVLQNLKHMFPEDGQGSLQFKILDFQLRNVSPSNRDLVVAGENLGVSLIALAALSYERATTYCLIQMTVSNTSTVVNHVHHIKCYKTPISDIGSWRPRLYLPRPYQTAFVIFETAVVLFSLAKMQDSPSSQLLMERHALPDPLQACIRFQDDTIFKVLGDAIEEQDALNRYPSCVLAIQGYGIVRVTSTFPEGPVDDPEEAQITLKSMLEQAVFFGTLRENPLNLSWAYGDEFSEEDFEEAALAISGEIISSSSKYLPEITPSLSQHIRLRLNALEDLASHLQKHSALLSRATRWKLLWNAEKLAATQAIWKTQETILKRKPKEREYCLMEYVLIAIHEEYKTKPEISKGENDRIRHWVTHDPGRIEHFLVMLVHAFDQLKEEEIDDPALIGDYFLEGISLWVAAYKAAFKYRENNAPLFGLGDEVLQDGVLTSGYSDLPEFWTSSNAPLRWGETLVAKACEFVKRWWNTPPGHPDRQLPRGAVVSNIASYLPEQVEILSRLLTEEANRIKEDPSEASEDKKTKADARKRKRLQDLIMLVAPYDNIAELIKIAEKLGDTALLVRLNLDYIKEIIHQGEKNPDLSEADAKRLEQKLFAIQARAETYYDTYGDKWANSHFQQMVHDGELGAMLAEAQSEDRKQPYLTRYLRKVKKYGKISWINDVIGQRDYLTAANTLDQVAETQETDLWSKKTELCLAKLADLAAHEKGQKGANSEERADISKYDKAISLLDIQDKIYIHVKASVGDDAIDVTAEQDIALRTFANRVVGPGRSVARELVEEALKALIEKRTMSPEQLIDLLTLMDPVEFSGSAADDPEILGHEFFLALKVIEAMPSSDIDAQTWKAALQRLVWRRAMVRDDWVILNETVTKTDDQVESEMMKSALFRTMAECLAEQQNDSPSGSRSALGSEEQIKLWSPEDILDADVFPDVLQERFRENERELVRTELEAEQEKLKHFVEKGRLAVHFLGLRTAAIDLVRPEAYRELGTPKWKMSVA